MPDDPVEWVLTNEEMESIESKIGYTFRNRTLLNQVYITPDMAKDINSHRKPGRYMEDNGNLSQIGLMSINLLNARLLADMEEVEAADDGDIDPEPPIEDDLTIPMMGAVSLDCHWNQNAMLHVANRILLPYWYDPSD